MNPAPAGYGEGGWAYEGSLCARLWLLRLIVTLVLGCRSGLGCRCWAGERGQLDFGLGCWKQGMCAAGLPVCQRSLSTEKGVCTPCSATPQHPQEGLVGSVRV